MLLKLLALFILVPLAELGLLLVVAHYTTIGVTLLLVIATGLAGTLLARSQGLRTFRRMGNELTQGKVPTEAALDAALIFCAGALLLTPGLLTDSLGILLLIPSSRRWFRARVVKWLRARFRIDSLTGARPEARSEIFDTYVIDQSDGPSPDRYQPK
ncbi:MAG: FxsA family protein [Pirellulaceae bacterium]